MYSEYLEEIGKKFSTLFDEVQAKYNFDLGTEFEVALCKALRLLLPEKYGVTRGFVVALDDSWAGDDIIIYDCYRFPTLRLITDDNYSQKQNVPVEAVYAYIEAKHTLYLDGEGGQSLTKACQQIKDVKSLCREDVPLNQIQPYTYVNSNNYRIVENWPNIRNPMYCAIISRRIANSNNDTISDSSLENILQTKTSHLSKNDYSPDLIAAGENFVCIPAVNGQIQSPFFLPGQSRLATFNASSKSVGLAMSMLSYALDWIVLGNIHWPSIIADGLDLPIQY